MVHCIVTYCNYIDRLSFPDRTKDLDPKASHDIVMRLTLDAVRVTHQAAVCLWHKSVQ